MIGTDGDLVSSIESGDYVILEADVCSQPYASFLGRAFRQYSDGLCTYLVTGRHVSPLRRVANTSSFLLYHSLETKLVHGCAVCGIAHFGNIVPRRYVIWHEVAPGFFQYDFIVLDL